MSTSSNEYIEHFGVRGMKWGVRKRSAKEEKERAKRFKASKNRRHLSDDELKARIERLNNEKKLKDLTDQDLKPGRTVAKKLVSESGQKVARNAVTGAGTLLIGAAIGKKFGPEAADVMQRGGLKKK